MGMWAFCLLFVVLAGLQAQADDEFLFKRGDHGNADLG